MTVAESFSAGYGEAREKFREAALAAGGALERISNPEAGPDGGELSTDVAWFGPRSAERVLVLISGTPGVEGFCGSGAQVDWLRRGEAGALPAGVAAMLVHAVNPYGFAWLRRVTEENVDLNRNWVDFAGPLPENAGYDELAAAIVPETWTPETRLQSRTALGAYSAEHGARGLQQALSGGQYKHPEGVFFGGAGVTWARRTQEAIFAQFLGEAGRVGIVDYHTGLGPWGFGEIISTEAPGSEAYRRACRWYGAGVTSVQAGEDSSSVELAGDGLAAAPVLLAHAEVTGVALEFGTQPGAQVFEALRADAWLHARGDPTGPGAAPFKAAIRDAFYGDTDGWKGMVAGQSLAALRAAMRALGAG